MPAENLLREVARTGKPLFVVLRAPGDASRIGRATADLGIPVILVGHHYDYSVENLAAAKRFEHLHLETSRMAHLDAVTVAVRELGAERVLYGTGAPIRAMQSALNAILQAQISDDEKRLVLGGNAQRLFGLPAEPVRLPQVTLPPRSIDVHTHFGPFPWDVPDRDDRELMPLLRERNNSVGAVESCVLAIASDLDAGNQRTVDLCRELSSGGQVGYLVADPTDRERAREHIRRWGDAPGIVGAKVHCQWSHRLTRHPQIAALFEVLADFGKPVKIHNDGDDWHERLLEIARRHPKLPIVIAHGGLGYPMLEGAELTVRGRERLFRDVQLVRAAALRGARDRAHGPAPQVPVRHRRAAARSGVRPGHLPGLARSPRISRTTSTTATQSGSTGSTEPRRAAPGTRRFLA